ncbi:trypsin-like serine peptidase [Saccharothrix deserti]|uniref:trypsin-like serine peptidase n=1 Tax=Saccharothrix deserti TaxID=2593674 RepID=UPI00131B7939|nr:trypsin-like serine protease [Saccharothrix deserti]
MLSALCLAAALTAVQTTTAAAAPALDPNTPISDDGRIGSQIQQIQQIDQIPTGRRLTTAGSAGTGNPADAKGVRPVTGTGPRVVAPDEFSTESIIAPDQRTQVTNTTTYPARANVYFTYRKPNGSTSWCTGWMYAANAVATAGHCVYSGGTGGAWNTNFTVYPGRNGSSSPYGSCGVSTAFSVTGWTQSASAEYDYAALKLTCTVGNTTGWYGLRWTTGSFNGTAVSSAGYPQDKASATQWFTSSTVSATYTRQLAYHLDTVGGQSGSAVYTSGCTTFCALAVHAYGYGDHNRGTRITEAAYNNFDNWKL